MITEEYVLTIKNFFSTLKINYREVVRYRAALHKTFSKLFLGQKEYDKALDELKNGVSQFE